MSPELDAKGYLTDFNAWTRDVAAELAVADGIGELSDDHWRVIEFLRAHQAAHGSAPMIRVLCKGTSNSLQQIYDLFPKGPAKGACRVAGLSAPRGLGRAPNLEIVPRRLLRRHWFPAVTRLDGPVADFDPGPRQVSSLRVCNQPHRAHRYAVCR